MSAWLAELWEAFKDWLLIAYMTAMEVVEWLHEQSDKKPWVSWLIHGLIALPIAYLGALMFALGVWLGLSPRWAAGMACAVSHYLWREKEQILHRLKNGSPLLPVDHGMDVASPIVSVSLAWLVS